MEPDALQPADARVPRRPLLSEPLSEPSMQAATGRKQLCEGPNGLRGEPGIRPGTPSKSTVCSIGRRVCCRPFAAAGEMASHDGRRIISELLAVMFRATL